MRRAATANAKLEILFWKSEASFLFEKYLTRLNEAFKELEDAGQALSETHLLKGIQNNDIQVQTTIGIVRNSFLSDFDAACIILSRTVSSRFASIESNRQKRWIGAIDTRGGGNRGNRGACGRGRHTGGRGGGRGTNRPMRVVMNGLDVTDISRNFTSDEWEKLRACRGHTYVTQRRKYASGRHQGGGRGDNRGGRNNRGGAIIMAGDITITRRAIRTNHAMYPQRIEIVEYDASNSTIATKSSSSCRGRQSGGRFGPRRSD